jgi:hypothetical protein
VQDSAEHLAGQCAGQCRTAQKSVQDSAEQRAGQCRTGRRTVQNSVQDSAEQCVESVHSSSTA